MRNSFFLIVLVFALAGFSACKCACDSPPNFQPLDFIVVDSTGTNLLDSQSWPQQFYYLKDGNKIPITDLSRNKFWTVDSIGIPAYYFVSDVPAKNSVEGIKNCFIELVAGDIDTLSIDAHMENEMTRVVTNVRFNGVDCKKDPSKGFVVWQIPKNM